jgi:hypothetical protein
MHVIATSILAVSVSLHGHHATKGAHPMKHTHATHQGSRQSGKKLVTAQTAPVSSTAANNRTPAPQVPANSAANTTAAATTAGNRTPAPQAP